MKQLIMILMVSVLAGCVSALPAQVSVGNDFNLTGVKTASVTMDCANVKTEDIDPASVPDFCQMLHASAKASIRKKTGYIISDDAADIIVNLKVEELYGGNAAARLLVGLGAGRSVITAHIEIVRDAAIIAEGRLVETSTIPHLAGSAWSNDEMITRDIGIIGGKLADFVINPRAFEARPEQPGYR